MKKKILIDPSPQIFLASAFRHTLLPTPAFHQALPSLLEDPTTLRPTSRPITPNRPATLVRSPTLNHSLGLCPNSLEHHLFQRSLRTNSLSRQLRIRSLDNRLLPSQLLVISLRHYPTSLSTILQSLRNVPRCLEFVVNRFAPTADAEYDPNPNPLPSGPIVPAMSNINIAAASSESNPALEIDVKTKFPVARIKRIMQADEDVGKVAQATPTAVAKALELFMITLVLKGANAAKDQNSKRVTAQHLKAALMADKEFDFLAECCADVPDEDRGGASKKGGRAKSEVDDSDEEMAAAPPKKRKSSKRKGSDESD